MGAISRSSEEETFSEKLFCNGEAVYVTYLRFGTCGCDLFNYAVIK